MDYNRVRLMRIYMVYSIGCSLLTTMYIHRYGRVVFCFSRSSNTEATSNVTRSPLSGARRSLDVSEGDSHSSGAPSYGRSRIVLRSDFTRGDFGPRVSSGHDVGISTRRASRYHHESPPRRSPSTKPSTDAL